jgi:hypothetical protein
MTEVDLRIESYFSLPTDLAGEMAAWEEFVSGSGYNVDLRSGSSSVTIRFERSDESQFVRICGTGGPLFDRAVGAAVRALAAHSDTLVVSSG